jgi:hypothetical protein
MVLDMDPSILPTLSRELCRDVAKSVRSNKRDVHVAHLKPHTSRFAPSSTRRTKSLFDTRQEHCTIYRKSRNATEPFKRGLVRRQIAALCQKTALTAETCPAMTVSAIAKPAAIQACSTKAVAVRECNGNMYLLCVSLP